MRELGEVIKLDGNNALVRVIRSSACGKCNACGMGADGKKFIDLTVLNTVDANLHDIVELNMDSPNILLAAFIVYGIPLIAMLTGIVSGYYILFKENVLYSTILAFVMLGLSFVMIRLNEDKIKSSNKFLPTMSRKISDDYNSIL